MTDGPLTDARTFVAERLDEGLRLDVALTRWLRGVRSATRTRLQQWIGAGKVRINGRVTVRPARPLHAGDRVAIELPWRRRVADHQPEAIPLDVVYEDEHLVVVSKPAGMIVHPTGRHRTGTLFNALLWHARDWPEGARPGLVHRLDRDTSGLVVVAKARLVHARTVRLLRGPQARKRYLAVVQGQPPDQGAIRLPLMRISDAPPRMGPAPAGEGLACDTRFEVLTRGRGRAADLAVVACELVTGRLHQIRAHLLASGWPIVGDPIYTPSPEQSGRMTGSCDRPRPGETRRAASRTIGARQDGTGTGEQERVWMTRQALHAWQLSIPHPVTGELLHLTASVPADMQVLIDWVEQA